MAHEHWHDFEIVPDAVDRVQHSISEFTGFDQVAAHIDRQLDSDTLHGYVWQCERISTLYAKRKRGVPDRDFLKRAIYFVQQDWKDHLRWLLTIAMLDGFRSDTGLLRIPALSSLLQLHERHFHKRGTKIHLDRWFTDFKATTKIDNLILIPDHKIERAQAIYTKWNNILFDRYFNRVPYVFNKWNNPDHAAVAASVVRKRAGLLLGIECVEPVVKAKATKPIKPNIDRQAIRDERKKALIDAAIKELEQAGRPVSVRSVAERINAAGGTIDRYKVMDALREMREAGQIAIAPKNQYQCQD